MPTAVRVLMVEDNPTDVEILVRTLREGGYDPDHVVVHTRAAFSEAIANTSFDIVLSDQKLPRFDGLSALALLGDSGQDIPFILVSGTVGEEKAVTAMKAGAADVVSKNNLGRLVPAINRELRERNERLARRRAEEKLHRREEQLRLALNAARMGTWDWDLQTGKLDWSEHAQQILRTARQGTVPTTREGYLALIPEDDRAVVSRALDEAIEKRTDYQVAHRLISTDGRAQWLGVKGRVYEQDGIPIRMSGTVADITDGKEAEAALIESEQRYRDLYEDAPVALFSINSDGDVVRANRETVRLFGFEARSLLGRSALQLFADSPGGRARMEELLKLIETKKAVVDEPIEVLRLGEDPWWGSISIKPVVNVSGDVVVFRATLVDITARREAEEVLQLGQRAIDQSPDLISICDADYRYRRVNDARARAHGRDASIVGMTVAEIQGKEIFERESKEPFDRCLAGEELAFETWVEYPATGRRFMSITYSPLRSVKGDIEGVIVIARDQTSRRRAEDKREALEAQLRQAQKMEALGTLAGGIAHDFNNLLLAILGYGELVRQAVEKDETLVEQVEHIIAAGGRAQTMVEQILQFGRKGEQKTEVVGVDAVAREVGGFLSAMAPAGITIKSNDSQGSALVVGDAGQIHQIILNLGVNSIHAMRDEGGTLTIDVSTVELDREFANGIGGVIQGAYVRIRVSDTGRGMPEDVIDRIYDPFFTTKGPGEGTGLGLSVVHGIVISHGGGMAVETTESVGTTFDVYLPLSGGAKPARARSAPGKPGEGERILFIDDEPIIADLGKRLLEKLGYRVVSVVSSVAAVEMFVDDPDAWDAIVTDQTMPGMTGLEVARRVRELRSSIPIVISTGFSEAVNPETLEAQGIDALVMKPYGGADMGRAVRQVLDAARQPSP